MLKPNNLLTQSNRLRRDIEHLHEATISKAKGFKEFINSANKILGTEEEIEKHLGKLLFDLIVFSELNNLNLEELLEEAYKNRK